MSFAPSPLEKLVKLIADELRIDDKIRDTQAVLMLVKKRVSESLAQHYIATRESRIQLPEDLMREEQSYERLLQALQDMKSEIAKQIRPVEEQIIQANVDHLRQTFGQESQRLSKCLGIRSGLFALNEKLTQLGAESIVIPDGLPTADLGEIVRQRIENLRYQGKI